MASFLDDLREENKKKGLFASNTISISYPLGFPVLDQQLGAVYIRKMPDGSITRDVHIGIPAGTFTIFTGQTSSGKTTAAIQAACNIVEPFGELGTVIHRDGEKSTGYDRVQAVSGWDEEKIKQCYSIERENSTWENVLSEIISISEMKEAKGEEMMYNTGQYDIWGNEYKYYVPTVIIIDSLLKFMSEKEAADTIQGLTAGGRGAIYNGTFFRNSLEYMYKYNINVFVINHMDDAMPDMMGRQKKKQMTFMPGGKYMSGGHKVKLLTSSMIYFIPHDRKDDIKTEAENGWNGVPTEAYVIKSRTSKGGFSAMLEFVQESGFDNVLTLMHFAMDNGLIVGRNPSCYFEAMPEVKFDTRKMMIELSTKPELTRALFEACKEPLMKLIPVVDTSDETNHMRSNKGKMEIKQMMRDIFTAN